MHIRSVGRRHPNICSMDQSVNESVPVVKDADRQQPVPTVWRRSFAAIVESLKEGDSILAQNLAGVRLIPAGETALMKQVIDDYGAELASLPEEAWKTSVCQRMLSHWDVLIDLFTVEEGASDLVLAARVRENEQGYTSEVQSVYVP